MKILPHIQPDNPDSSWSNDWYTQDGNRIACPKCGCTTVSPVPVDEAFSHFSDVLDDYQDKESKHQARKYLLTEAMGLDPRDIYEIKNPAEHLDEIENLHRKHGIFFCGNEDCLDNGYGYFGIRAIKKGMPKNSYVWDNQEKRQHGYDNPWSIDIEKPNLPTIKEHW
jgi:hypothetical protein